MKTNNFIHRIEKEEVNKLPIAEFEGDVFIVDDNYKLLSAMRYLNSQTIVGVDTETRPSFQHGQHYPTALVQIATNKRCYLFQLKHIGMPDILADLFANPAIIKVGLAFADDLRGLQKLHPFKPQNCIDIQKMVLQYGILDLGLQKIFAIVFQKKISKAQQLTNWSNDKLTPEQARYASTDAWATLCIYQELMSTERLPKKEYEALRQLDIQRMVMHQQQMMLQKQNNENSNTKQS